MSKAEIIAKTFDLQKRNKLCNIHSCEKLPSKKVIVYEENRITREKKTLASVYLCSTHNETRIPSFITEMNENREVGKIITKKVSEVGLITY